MFQLSEGMLAIRQAAHEFARTHVLPGADERDREGRFPREIVQEAARRGYMGLLVPESLGGQGLGNLEQCLILEEIAWADASTHVTLSVHSSLVCSPLVKHGSEDLKRRYLPRLASGEWIGAYALTEPQSGTDAASLSTRAVRDGDHWVLNGSKMWITTGISANLMVIFARTNPDAPKSKGITAFAVETSTPGLTTGKKENKLGLRASETVQVFLEDVRVPAENVIGEVDGGFPVAMETLDGGRVGIAVQSVGIARAALERCLALTEEQRVADRASRLSQDQHFRLAEMATAIDAARLLTWRAAALADRGEKNVKEASMAKLMASEICNRVCQEGVALAGAAGWLRSGGIERLFRDARVTELYEGTTEVQKLVISRHLGAG